MSLEIKNLHKTFNKRSGKLTVLNNINLKIDTGEFLCLLGPSGSGKTTLLRIIAGLETPTSGDIFLHGQPVTQPDLDRGLVFQDFALFPWYTVRMNVEFGLINQKYPPGHRDILVDELLENMGLAEFADYYPKEISGGMQQRVAIARALAVKPKVLLMDEPFGSLDAQTRNRLQEFLVDIWEKTGITVIFVTHSVDEATFLATRIVSLTNLPGSVGLSLYVELPYPRVRTEPSFLEIRQEFLNYLQKQSSNDNTKSGQG